MAARLAWDKVAEMSSLKRFCVWRVDRGGLLWSAARSSSTASGLSPSKYLVMAICLRQLDRQTKESEGHIPGHSIVSDVAKEWLVKVPAW